MTKLIKALAKLLGFPIPEPVPVRITRPRP